MAFFESTPFGAFGRPPELQSGGATGIAMAIMQQKMQQQKQVQEGISGVADMMKQRRNDEIANKLMDQYASDFGIDPAQNPFRGQGQTGLEAAMQMMKMKKLQQESQTYPFEIGGQEYPLSAKDAANAALYKEGFRGGAGAGLTEYQQERLADADVARTESAQAKWQARYDRLREEERRHIEAAGKEEAENAQNLKPGVHYRAEKALSEVQRQIAEMEKSKPELGAVTTSNVPSPGGVNQPVKVSTQAERDALPPGTVYIAPDGSYHTKQ